MLYVNGVLLQSGSSFAVGKVQFVIKWVIIIMMTIIIIIIKIIYI